MAISESDVQKAYLAYFGRPADPAGLAYWETQSTSTMYASFASSSEYESMYSGMTNTQVVAAVYQNIFGREADTAGLLYWTNQLTSGAVTMSSITVTMINSALGADVTTINNRITYAEAYTAALDTTAEIVAYAGSAAATAARTALAPVTTAESLTVALSSLSTSVQTMTTAGQTGTTYTLTTGVDSIMGTSGDDTFNAALSGSFNYNTINSLDSLDGGAGNDTLNVAMNGGTATPQKIANIETINFTSAGALFSRAALNLLNAPQVTALNVYGSSAASVLTNIVAGTALSVVDQDANVAFAYAVKDASATANVTVEDFGTTPGVTSLTVNNVGKIAIDATGTNDIFDLSADTATALTFSGTAQAVTANISTLKNTVSSVDASYLTGDFTFSAANSSVATSTVVTVIGGSGNDTLDLTGYATNTLAVDGGAGNDLISVTGGKFQADKDTLVGGDGTDTLAVKAADITALDAAKTTLKNVSEFEGVKITDALSSDLTLSMIQAGLSAVTLASGTGKADTVTFDSGVAGTVYLGDSTSSTSTLGGALTVKSAGAGTTDAITIVNKSTTTNAFNGQSITATGVETLTLSSDLNDTVGAITLTPTSGLSTLDLTGSASFTVNGAITATTIDASGLTGTNGLIMNATPTSGVTSILGSSGNDTLRSQAAVSATIDGGAGDDLIFGSSKADSLVGGAGNDFIIGNGGNDTILGGDGNDTIRVSAGKDIVNVDGGAGDDVVTVLNGLTTGDVITGGDGTDTLIIGDTTVAASAALGVTGFEELNLASGGQTIDLNNFINNKTFTQIDYGTGINVITNAGAGITTLKLASATSDSFSRLVDTASDAITITPTGIPDVTVGTLAINGEETATIATSTDATAMGSTFTLNNVQAKSLTSLTATGVENVAMSLTGATNLATIDASALTGTFNVNASCSTVNGTFTGSATAANTITGGSGNDVITGGDAEDSLFGGAGNDTILGGKGVDILSGGAGNDSIVGGAGNDTLLGGYGNDILIGGTGNDILSGDAGNDTIDLSTGMNDTVIYATAVSNGVDAISGFTAGTGTGADTLDLSVDGAAQAGLIKGDMSVGVGATLNGVAVVYESDGLQNSLTEKNFSTTTSGTDVIQVSAGITYVAYTSSASLSATSFELYQYDSTTDTVTDLGSVSLTGGTTLDSLAASNFKLA